MFAKLLKYNLKKELPAFFIFFGIGITAAIISRLLDEFFTSAAAMFISDFCAGITWSMIFSALINALLRTWAHFRIDFYGDESYLTHTLPLKTSTIFQSKFVTALIIFFISIIIGVIEALIILASPEFFSALADIIPALLTQLNISNVTAILSICLLALVEMITVIAIGFYSVIIGQQKDDKKSARAWITGMIVYLASQLSVIAVALFSGIFDHSILQIFSANPTTPPTSAISSLLIILPFVYLVIIFIINRLSVRALRRGVNVE